MFDDLHGQQFGKLTVRVPVAEARRSRSKRWLCQCECGGSKVVRADSLRAGKTTDCGCVKRHRVRLQSTTHGKSYSKVYTVWKNMIARCYRPSYIYWENYGGRGIRVCDEWRKFEVFYAYVGDPPPGMTLDRWPNNNGHYEPGNVRWATRSQQMLNTRKSKMVR
jgi:hypothetical protein